MCYILFYFIFIIFCFWTYFFILFIVLYFILFCFIFVLFFLNLSFYSVFVHWNNFVFQACNRVYTNVKFYYQNFDFHLSFCLLFKLACNLSFFPWIFFILFIYCNCGLFFFYFLFLFLILFLFMFLSFFFLSYNSFFFSQITCRYSDCWNGEKIQRWMCW